MFDHVSIGVRDLAMAKAFYDATLSRSDYAASARTDLARLRQGGPRLRLWIGATDSPVPDDPKSGLHSVSSRPTRQQRSSVPCGGARRTGAATTASRASTKDYGPDYYAAFVVIPRATGSKPITAGD